MSMRGTWLEDLTWDEAKQRFDRGWPVIVPVGAIAKEHGLHLPLKTDWVTARALGQRLADHLPVVVAPVVPFGFYPAFVDYAGSQHLAAETFMALVRELLGNLIDHGVRRILIVNTGVSTEAPLALVLADIHSRSGVRVYCAHMRLLGRAADGLLERPEGGHGDERETSIMLALDPRSVRMNRLQPAGDRPQDYGSAAAKLARPFRLRGEADAGEEYTATGALGDPRAATAFKGERILAEIVGELEGALRVIFPDAFSEPQQRS
jgi:creatinine amidohydrolase